MRLVLFAVLALAVATHACDHAYSLTQPTSSVSGFVSNTLYDNTDSLMSGTRYGFFKIDETLTSVWNPHTGELRVHLKFYSSSTHEAGSLIGNGLITSSMFTQSGSNVGGPAVLSVTSLDGHDILPLTESDVHSIYFERKTYGLWSGAANGITRDRAGVQHLTLFGSNGWSGSSFDNQRGIGIEFRAAIECDAALVPVCMFGSDKLSSAGSFRAQSHSGAAMAPPAYGMRLDNLYGNEEVVTFGFSGVDSLLGKASMRYTFDGVDKVTVSGTMFGGIDAGDDWTETRRYSVHFTFYGADVNGQSILLPYNANNKGQLVETTPGRPSKAWHLVSQENEDGAIEIGFSGEDNFYTLHAPVTHWQQGTNPLPHYAASNFLFTIGECIEQSLATTTCDEAATTEVFNEECEHRAYHATESTCLCIEFDEDGGSRQCSDRALESAITPEPDRDARREILVE